MLPLGKSRTHCCQTTHRGGKHLTATGIKGRGIRKGAELIHQTNNDLHDRQVGNIRRYGIDFETSLTE